MLFSLELATGDHELGLLLAELISLHLEFSIHGLVAVGIFLNFPLGFEALKLLSHLLADLLWGLERCKEFLFILLIFVGKKLGKFGPSLLEVGLLSSLEVSHSISSHLLYNFVVSFCLPSGLEEHVFVTLNSIMKDSFSLNINKIQTYSFNSTSIHDVGIGFELMGHLNN